MHTIDNVLKNWTDRVGYSIAKRGCHLNTIIFHYYPEGLYFQIKKRNLKKYSVVFFKHFPKNVIWRILYNMASSKINLTLIVTGRMDLR